MRVISFCADGIKDAAQKGFYDWVVQQDADIICIQDLRAQEYDLQDDIYFPEGYFPYFFDSPDSVNGVAVYVRQMPKAIMTGLGFGELDIEARYIQADFERVSVGCLLAPSAYQGDSDSYAAKLQFFDQLQAHFNKIRHKRREYVIAGSWFMAHEDRDLQNPSAHENDYGFLPEEREWLDILFNDLEYQDSFRAINADNDEFTWWPEGNRDDDGWRSDFQIISRGINNRVEYGTIYKNQVFSSHAPIIMDYDIELG